MNARNIIILCTLLFPACNSPRPEKEEPVVVETVYPSPASGEIVAVDSMKIKEEELNDFYFVVEIAATDQSAKGMYSVLATWGHYLAEGSLQMPKGGERLPPVLRRGEQPYTYLVGFYYKDDTTFHEYFQVQGRKGQIEMKYLKSYAIQ